MMNADNVKRRLLGALLDLYTGVLRLDRQYGICANLDCAGVRGYRVRDDLFKAWPEYSGDIMYPVPGYDEDNDPSWKYDYTYDLWDTGTEYGRARWRLLWWCCITLMRELGEVQEIEPPPMPLDAVLADKVRALYVGAA